MAERAFPRLEKPVGLLGLIYNNARRGGGFRYLRLPSRYQLPPGITRLALYFFIMMKRYSLVVALIGAVISAILFTLLILCLNDLAFGNDLLYGRTSQISFLSFPNSEPSCIEHESVGPEGSETYPQQQPERTIAVSVDFLRGAGAVIALDIVALCLYALLRRNHLGGHFGHYNNREGR